jgi:hypothetical protein
MPAYHPQVAASNILRIALSGVEGAARDRTGRARPADAGLVRFVARWPIRNSSPTPSSGLVQRHIRQVRRTVPDTSVLRRLVPTEPCVISVEGLVTHSTLAIEVELMPPNPPTAKPREYRASDAAVVVIAVHGILQCNRQTSAAPTEEGRNNSAVGQRS